MILRGRAPSYPHGPPVSIDPLQACDPWEVPPLSKGKGKNRGKNNAQLSNSGSAQTIHYITIENVVEVPAAKPLTREASTYTSAEIFASCSVHTMFATAIMKVLDMMSCELFKLHFPFLNYQGFPNPAPSLFCMRKREREREKERKRERETAALN